MNLRTWVLIAFIVGFLLHVLILMNASGPFSPKLVGFLGWSLLPYATLICLFFRTKYKGLWCIALFAILVSDVVLYYQVFISPTRSTAAIALITTPLAYLICILIVCAACKAYGLISGGRNAT